MSFVQIVRVEGIAADQYDKVIQAAYGGKLDDGELFHVAGPSGDAWYVIDGWESREQCDRSLERLMPALQEAGIELSEMPAEFQIHRLEMRA